MTHQGSSYPYRNSKQQVCWIKVGWSKPGVVLAGYNCPGQYSRSGQYWLIGGQLKIEWSIEFFSGHLKMVMSIGFHFGGSD